MAQSYEEDYADALETLREDGYPVTLIKKGEPGGGYDDLGNPLPSTPDEEYSGHGITVGYSAFYIANDIAKAGDVRLLFVSNSLSPEYLAFYEGLEKGGEQCFANVNGTEWRIVKSEQVKPTTTQIIAKIQLRR